MLSLLMLTNVSSSNDGSEMVRMLTNAMSTKPKYHVLAHLIHNTDLETVLVARYGTWSLRWQIV